VLSLGRPTIPGYEVLRLLGAGTYGHVWLARDQGDDSLVAIKCFLHGVGLEWKEEVRKLRLLDTIPGIVRLWDFCPDADPPYYIMPYAQQGSLAEHLDKYKQQYKQPLPVKDAHKLFRQLVEALAYVHVRGIRHCDLKPANILLDAAGLALIADFGQAHLSDDSSPALGTFFYMAPEQANLMVQIADTRWDVYGLGALCYEMVTGSPPRAAEEIRVQLEGTQHLSHRLNRYREWIDRAPPPSLHRRVRGMDADLARIIDRCLAINPNERYRDAGAVLAALEERQRRRQRRPFLLIGLAATFVALLFVAVSQRWMNQDAIQESEQELSGQVLRDDEVTAHLIANVVQEKLEERTGLLISYVERPGRPDRPDLRTALRDQKPQELQDQLVKMMTRAQSVQYKFTEAAIVDRRGIVRALVKDRDGKPELAEPALEFAHYTWRDYFNGQGTQPYDPNKLYPPIESPHISDPYVTASDRYLCVSISLPIPDPDHADAQPIGVLEAAIRVEEISQWLLEAKDAEAKWFPVLLDKRRYCVLHQEDKIKPHGPSDPPPRFSFATLELQLADDQARGMWGGQLAEHRDPVDDKVYLAGYAPMKNPEIGWVALVQHERAAALQPVEKLQRAMWLTSLKTLGIACVLMAVLWGGFLWTMRRAERLHHG
jgi:hypothetical protein